MTVSIEELRRIVHKILTKYGYSEGEIGIMREVLMYGQLRDKDHGLNKLLRKNMIKSKDADEITIEKETKLSARINGNHHAGMVVLDKAMRMALQKAKEHGFGIVGTNNTGTSSGAIGYFAHEVAKRGFIGFVYAGNDEMVCAYGSYEALLGTNPLAIGVPSTEGPMVLDMGTSKISWHKLLETQESEHLLPEQTAYDSEGKFTIDPTKARSGALLTFDNSPKSSGISMMIQLLTGPLVGAAFAGIGATTTNMGHLIYVLDPELLTDAEEFKKNVTLMKERVKATKKLPGVEEIFVPGERGDRLAQSRIDAGEMEIEDSLVVELKKIIGEKVE
ncbi:MAG: Ldh family oxidoreductase [bacterium]|nr:Ldh family oxidoreductase [bacterium]